MFFLFVSVVSIVFLSIAFYILSSNIIKENSNKLLINLIDQIANEIDSLFADSHRTLRMVANDPKIQRVLRNPYPTNISELYSVELEVDTQLSFVQSYEMDIFGIYIIGANGTKYKSNFFSGIEGNWENTWWYDTILRSTDTVWIGPHNGAFIVETINQPFVSFGESIIDKASGKSLGIILVDIEVKTIEELLKANLGDSGSIYLIDERDRIICGIGGTASVDGDTDLPDLIREVVNNSPGDAQKYRTRRYLVYSKQLGVNNWRTVGLIPKRELTRGIGSIAVFILILFAGICLFDILAALYFAGRVANPIKQLMILMKKVETGDFNVNMDITRSDEIGKLSESFNIMVKRLDSLMKILYDNQQKLRKAELRALQAQINPHFLYNTLDSICWLARADQKDEIISTVMALTRLLRIGLSKGDEIIPIREEIEHVQNYLIIQKVRYKKGFDYVIEVPNELGDFKILKLVLQPLAENALYHGIKNKKEKGIIRIAAWRNDGVINFSVSDTGIGMNKMQVKKLANTLKESESSRAGGYGLKNVNERMRIFFGEKYGLSFKSEVGKGTTVIFQVPILEGE